MVATPVVTGESTSGDEGPDPYPKASLLCRPNSHPFEDRLLTLDQAVKVGRSVARARPASHNAIFDCKVLSRNHALIWYENGKFFLQDTKSSNGTFVNNQRLSKGSEESLPREVCSGDILQFGVDVMENSRKVTHGCIIATLKLYLPDGKEAKASPTIMNADSGTILPPEDLHQLNQYIQEALTREQLLETKLAVLQRIVNQTGLATQDAWKSLIDEDRLLTRVEILESHLTVYEKSMTEDKAREEAARLIAEKEQYQEVAKTSLKNMMEEKVKATKATHELQSQLSAVEDEFAMFRDLYQRTMDENKELAILLSELKTEYDALKAEVPKPPTIEAPDTAAIKSDMSVEEPSENVAGKDPDPLLSDPPSQKFEKFDPNTTIEIHSEPKDCTENNVSDDQERDLRPLLNGRLNNGSTEDDLVEDSLSTCTSVAEDSLSRISVDNDLSEIAAIERCDSAVQTSNDDQLPSSSFPPVNLREAYHEDLLDLQRALDEKIEEVNELRQRLSESLSASVRSEDPSSPQLSQLLRYKEKYMELSEERKQMEDNFVALEKAVEAISLQSQTTSACSVIPLAILFVSIIVAYLPTFAAILGTTEKIN
ncbi:hypothetical protein TCAL_00011 [Tigriopus californicus]|uniref:Sarcolemmal membrane-associated protein n=1 Tax=Tigriopus californicus TaxID=6832 RepID=A0A553PF90_TIGCA|nr:sarcolemmal membrane-associated protein-like [Tigriopus californicus]TRY76365.1 hypothetical protein TCAL_00011 [Tigriopus californicus]|eukprot:TCALIF_00011-PA protein Name:"Similar to SLMAP Sarcolemmal membrane-associated protein (Oryctolagus cuniculus)" AED:0.24 eAED:0.26 QI:0/-1/0/1/-1/1/1/0/597